MKDATYKRAKEIKSKIAYFKETIETLKNESNALAVIDRGGEIKYIGELGNDFVKVSILDILEKKVLILEDVFKDLKN